MLDGALAARDRPLRLYTPRVFEIGSSLRDARLRQGFDVGDAERATKIRSRYLEALEEERFDVLPAQTYVKGFLRSYAEFLGLDGQLYVDEYNSRYVAGEDETAVAPRRQTARRAQWRVESRALVLALAGIAAVTALVIVAWKWGGEQTPRVPNLKAGPPAAAPTGARRAKRASTAGAKKKPWIRLTLTAARGDSWLSVRRGTNVLFVGTLRRGTTREWVGPRLRVNAGAPDVLVARVNKRRARIPGGGSPAVLVATRRGIVPLQGR